MKKLIIVASLLLSSMAYATEYSLDSAITKAFENNLEINRAQKDIEIKKIDYKKSVKQLLPKITLSSSFMKLNDDINMLGKTISNSDTPYSNKLVLQQPLFVGGAVLNGIKFLKYGEEIADIQMEQKKREIRINVLQNYVAILKTNKNKEILENALKEMTETYGILNQKLELDIIAKKPVLDMNYRILELKANLVSLNNELDIRKLALKNLMGVAKNEDINIKDLDIPNFDMSSIDLNKDIEFANTNKSAMKTLEIAKELSEVNKNIKRADLLPKIYFRFNYETYGKEYGSSTSGTWNAGITASMNILDFGITLDDMSKSKKEIEQKQIDQELARDKVEISLRSSYMEMDRLNSLITIKKEALESSKENYRVEKQKLDLDMTTATEFLNAENDYRKAEIELINAKLDLYVSYIKYMDTVEREEI